MKTLSELMDMRGQRALITGATGYLGQVMARTLAEIGADLILVDRPGSSLSELQNKLIKTWDIKVISLTCDLESEEERNLMINRVKTDDHGLSCLINNAAFVGSSNLQGWIAPFEEQTLETWRRAFEVNLTAAFHLSQSFTPKLRESNNGNIINICSIYGEIGPNWSLYEGTEMGNPAAYASSKGGLLQLTRWLATTLAPDIRVNAISPGGIIRGQEEKFIRRYIEATPLKRMATENDICGAVAYLASNMSRYVTGEVIHVDGGWITW